MLNDFSQFIQEYFLGSSILSIKDQEFIINTLKDLITSGFELVKKGVSVQRYKGLGEMNPEQLWETTLDPGFRSILKVKVEDAQRADEIFDELMGDDVEKRKIFIQSNAKKVSNFKEESSGVFYKRSQKEMIAKIVACAENENQLHGLITTYYKTFINKEKI